LGKTPAFQLYAADFYMDTNSWSIDEIGIYTRLLFSEWVNGPLPNDITRLARIAGCSTKRFQKGWSQIKLKFSETEDNKLFNPRLEEVRQKHKEYQEKQRLKGIKGAEKRWSENMAAAIAPAMPVPQPEHGSSSSTLNNIVDTTYLLSSAKPTTAHPNCPHKEIISAYNEILGPYMPTVKEHLWNGTRARNLQARWRERAKRQSVEWWRELFMHIRDDMPFLLTPWKGGGRCNLGWIVKPDNFAKILEGNYVEEGRPGPGGGAAKPGMVDGMLSRPSDGKEPCPKPPPPDGGQGVAVDTVQVAGDGGGGDGRVQEGD